MDKLKRLYNELTEKEKNAILFDRITHFPFKDAINRLSSYPDYILSEFLITYNEGFLSDFISEVKKLPKTLNKKNPSYTFKIFSRFNKTIELEEREGQKRMIEDIEYTIDNNHVFIGEAPPGTGKSLAYLVPILNRILKNKRAVISTNTKNLQMQIFRHDLEIAGHYVKTQFSASVIKGISNYLCLLKYDENKSKIDLLMKFAIEGFIFTSASGDISELKFFQNLDYSDILAENEYCVEKDCPFFSKCYFMKVKEQSRTADIILTNHYLSLIDNSLGNKFFGKYDIIVFDEAHNLENVITELFSYKFNFNYVFKTLYYFIKRLNNEIKYINRKMILGKISQNISEIIVNIEKIIDDLQILSFSIKERMRSSEIKVEYNSDLFNRDFDIIARIKRNFESIDDLINAIFDFLRKNYPNERSIFHTIRYLNDKILSFYDVFSVIVNPDNVEYAFYYEIEKNENIIFNALPVDTGEIFSKLFLKDETKTDLFISATLGVNKDFSFFNKQIGLYDSNRKFVTDIYETSFEWEEQMKINIVSDMGDPNSSEFLKRSAEIIKKIAEEEKNTLVLTTSYEQIDYLKKKLKGKKYIFQKKKQNSELLLDKFINKKGKVLIGTSRFWEGVDLPGKLLERIIILKMPFAVPTDPIVKKRNEKIANEGKNPFMEYQLPNAILRLKQGIGRLIRKKDDMGIIYLLDERIIKKRYGKIIVNSLFVKPKIISYKEI